MPLERVPIHNPPCRSFIARVMSPTWRESMMLLCDRVGCGVLALSERMSFYSLSFSLFPASFTNMRWCASKQKIL